MRVIGHRGAAAVAPENTVVAIEAAIAAGADAVEVDVRLTADGVAVLLHDDDVARVTDGTGSVGSLTFAAVRDLDASARHPGWERVPVATLDEALATVRGRVGLVLELKPTFDAGGIRPPDALVRAVLERARSVEGLIVSSFDPAALALMRAEAPEITTASTVIRGSAIVPAVEAAATAGHAEVHIAASDADPPAIAAAHAAGLAVCVWTVNDGASAIALRSSGVDGVFTDDPGAIRSALDAPAPGR